MFLTFHSSAAALNSRSPLGLMGHPISINLPCKANLSVGEIDSQAF